MKPFLSLAHVVACLSATSASATNSQVVKVVLGEDGKAVPKAQLRVWESPGPRGGRKFRPVVADAAGRAEISFPPGGTVYVEAVEPGLLGRAVVIGQGGTHSSDPIELTLWLGTPVTGRILEPDGSPAAHEQIEVGVYVLSQEWKRRFGISLAWMSWDHGQWPNWRTTVQTDQQGRFQCTVPPREARSWIRVGNTSLSFAALSDVALAGAEPKPLAARFAPFERDHEGDESGRVDVGEIRLTRGVILHGRVLDAEGKPLSGITLITSGRHGHYAGRRTISNERGEYRFMPQAPGGLNLSVDARHRDENGQVSSRDVRAIFAKIPITLTELVPEQEIIVRAEKSKTLKFNFVDRRNPPAERISYYNHLTVTGRLEVNGKLQSWRGETRRVGDQLFLKIPAQLQQAKLVLPGDKFARLSYEDETGLQGTGRIDLPDLDPNMKRTVFADPAGRK